MRSHDGTRLTYYVGGDPHGVPLVFCGGLGGGIRVWHPFFERFGARFRLLSWDYRGLYRSGPARGSGAYGVEQHARDLLHLLQHEGVARPVLVGWSMGVQVSLEAHRADPALARGLVAIHGTAGSPLTAAFGALATKRLAPAVFAALRGLRSRLAPAASHLARSRLVVGGFVGAAQRLGLMAPSLDVCVFQDVVEEWLRLDLAAYAQIFERIDEHDASDLLASIHAPALAIAGGRDRFTPTESVRRMVLGMRRATLEIVPGATHFGLLEFPELIVQRVESYLRHTLECVD